MGAKGDLSSSACARRSRRPPQSAADARSNMRRSRRRVPRIDAILASWFKANGRRVGQVLVHGGGKIDRLSTLSTQADRLARKVGGALCRVPGGLRAALFAATKVACCKNSTNRTET